MYACHHCQEPLDLAEVLGTHLQTIVRLRDKLIALADDEGTSSGVIPQYAKQIRDLSAEIEERTPQKKEATELDSHRNAATDLIPRG